MSEMPRQVLAELVKRFGAELINDHRRCKSLLHDALGDRSGREMFILMDVVERGIALELSLMPRHSATDALLGRLSHRLSMQRGISIDLADWGVESWAIALGAANQPQLSSSQRRPEHDMSQERWLAPSLADIEALTERALASIPAELKRHLGPVVIRVDEFPDEETEGEMGLGSPFDALSSYRGEPLPLKNGTDRSHIPDMIFLYRRPILDYWCETGEPLQAIVRHNLIFQIGHHFGFTDEQMARIEAEG